MAHPDSVEAFYELTQAKARHCHALDARDWTALSALLAADTVLDQGDGSAPAVGRDQVLATLRTALREARSVHQAHTPLLDLDGDTARVVWTTCDRIVWDDGHSESRFGHCHERWVRTGDGWLLASLRRAPVVVDAGESTPITIYEAVRRATGDIAEFATCVPRSTRR